MVFIPAGYIITGWDEDEGITIESVYPPEIKADPDDMMRIFYAHITGSEEAGYVSVRLKKMHLDVYSYFTGMNTEYPIMINLLLNTGEDPEMFGESVLEAINRMILGFFKNGRRSLRSFGTANRLKDFLKRALFLLERLTDPTREQIFARIYAGDKGRAVMNILRDGAISKKRLVLKLEDMPGISDSDPDTVLDYMMKVNLIEQDWIAGLRDVYLFPVSDFEIIRVPPGEILRKAMRGLPDKAVSEKYLENLRHFFGNYIPNESDGMKLAEILINPDKYDLLVLFRNNFYPRNKIPGSGRGGIFPPDKLIEEMIEDNILSIIRDERDTEWVMLLSDIKIETFYPLYLIGRISEVKLDGKRSGVKHSADDGDRIKVIIRHLEFLERSYVPGVND